MKTRRLRTISLALLCAPAVFCAQVQKPGLTLPSSASTHRQAVRDIFTDSYQAYRHAYTIVGCNPPKLNSCIGNTLSDMMIFLLSVKVSLMVVMDGARALSMPWELWFVSSSAYSTIRRICGFHGSK